MSNAAKIMDKVKYSTAHHIEFECISCRNRVSFSILEMADDSVLTCSKCGKQYKFDKELLGKIRRFENLLVAVHDVKDMLETANIAIAVKDEEVKVPYRLLLTRLNTLLKLSVNGKELTFRFRVDPISLIED